MSTQFFRRSESGQIAVLLAVGMIGLIGIVGLALDGGMLFWNQRRAQNAADAAAVAGVSRLAELVTTKGYHCATSSDASILNVVREYAADNEIPDALSGDNVTAYYLVRDSGGNLVDLALTTETGSSPWEVGATGKIPCAKVAGLRVETWLPQPTFIAGVLGITETNVRVEASAMYKYNTWCSDFAVIALNTACNYNVLGLTGSDISLDGGAHSNGGMQIGGGGQEIYLEPYLPVEHGESCSPQIGNYDKIIGGPDPTAADKGIGGGEYLAMGEDDIGYRFEDFATGGWVWDEVPADQRFDFGTSNINTADIKNPDGTLIDGLYVTEGNIKLNRVSNVGDQPWRATLVAGGTVEISGGFSQVPMARGVFILSFSSDLSSGAINLSGDGNEWQGLILAPNGKISASAAKNSDVGGMIVGYEVDLSGSNISIQRRNGYCPFNPPRVLLVD